MWLACTLAWLGECETPQHSPTPNLKLYAHTDKALSCCIAEACSQGISHCLSEAGETALPITLSSCLANASGQAQSTHGIPLDHLALVVKGAGAPGTITIKKTVLGRPSC